MPSGDEWVHEVKWDGMRVLADVREGRLTLWSRTERDVTVAYPELAGLADLYDDVLLDGEVVALRDGVPSFHALADRMHVTSARKAQQLALALVLLLWWLGMRQRAGRGGWCGRGDRRGPRHRAPPPRTPHPRRRRQPRRRRSVPRPAS